MCSIRTKSTSCVAVWQDPPHMLNECDQALPRLNQPRTVAARTLTCVAVPARGKSTERKVQLPSYEIPARPFTTNHG